MSLTVIYLQQQPMEFQSDQETDEKRQPQK